MRDAFISPPPASKRSRSIKVFGKPYSLDVTDTVKAPGYLPVAYLGVGEHRVQSSLQPES